MSALNISIRSSNRERGGFDRATRFKKKKRGRYNATTKSRAAGIGQASAMQIPDFRDRIENSNCNVSLFPCPYLSVGVSLKGKGERSDA